MQNALDEMVIDGIKTNIPLQARIIASARLQLRFAHAQYQRP
jgi:biotin carboxylase